MSRVLGTRLLSYGVCVLPAHSPLMLSDSRSFSCVWEVHFFASLPVIEVGLFIHSALCLGTSGCYPRCWKHNPSTIISAPRELAFLWREDRWWTWKLFKGTVVNNDVGYKKIAGVGVGCYLSSGPWEWETSPWRWHLSWQWEGASQGKSISGRGSGRFEGHCTWGQVFERGVEWEGEGPRGRL